MSDKPKLKKVFFVDDDEATNAFHLALSKDYNLAESVQVFDNVTEALSALEKITNQTEFPELIFIDINMPKIDGHECAKRIQHMEGYDQNASCIALLTSSKDIKDVIKADGGSVEQYFWKPLTASTLTRVLKEGLDID